MAAQTVRVAVIGTSFASSVQIPGFQQCGDVEIVAVASGREERARQTAEKFGIPRAYGDWRQMLDEVECDLVSIVTPPYLHHDMAIASIHKGRHVLCEKPFAMNVSQARDMVHQARARHIVHGVDHEFRYRPARMLFKEMLEAGYIGEPRVIRWAWLMPFLADAGGRKWDWWMQREMGGGLFGALGSHLIDSLLWWFGDISEVSAQLNTFVRERADADGELRAVTADDDVAMLLRFARGARASVDLTGMARAGGRRLEVWGSEGTLVIDEDSTVLAAPKGGQLAEVPIPDRLKSAVGGDERIAPFIELAERMLARIRGGERGDFADFHQGLRVQAVMDAAHASSDTGRVVSVENV
jgi:predicted dehydrogenase